jgi:hypothetical protein
MRILVIVAVAIVCVTTACSQKRSQQVSVDTTAMFAGVHPPASWTDSIMAVVDAYGLSKISADSAAQMMADIAKGRSLNLAVDEPLIEAMQRELQRRHH